MVKYVKFTGDIPAKISELKNKFIERVGENG
jgi:hypothetical protein